MPKKQQALRAKKGFTLVELIVVIAIIGVLAALLVPTLSVQLTRSRVTSADRGARSLYDDVQLWFSDDFVAGGNLPTDGAVGISAANGSVTVTNEPTKAARHNQSLKAMIESDYAARTFSAVVYIKNGKIFACTLQDGTASMAVGAPTDTDFSVGSFSWGGSEEGVTSSGDIVGTYPKLRTT